MERARLSHHPNGLDNEIIGRPCLYQKPDENGYHPAIPYGYCPSIPEENPRFDILYLDVHRLIRPVEGKNAIKVTRNVPRENLQVLDPNSSDGRRVYHEILMPLAIEIIAARSFAERVPSILGAFDSKA